MRQTLTCHCGLLLLLAALLLACLSRSGAQADALTDKLAALATAQVVPMVEGRAVSFPVGHDQIVTLHITGLPDAGLVPTAPEPRTARMP